ncbi:MAG: hypothetical protein HFJ33_04835 [Clostridia bacterium]|nr:hypothetical protein [Clostridia bacterium]
MSSQILKYKDAYFYSYIKSLIKEYSIKHQDRILMKYVDSDSLKTDEILNNLDNEKFLSNDKLEIDIVKFIEEYLVKTKSYIDFKNNKVFILDNLLKNAKGYDEKGNIVDIKLDLKQKEIVIKQYNESFEDEIKSYIENNSDEFEEIFIANNNMQFEKLFPKTYVETLKEQAISRFRNDGVMEAIRYGLAYPEELKSAMSRRYVNNNKFKTLLVFNNNKNILGLTKENFIEETKEQEIEKTQEKETIEKKNTKEKDTTSIFITLSGNEKETYKGIYLPISDENVLYIPKQLYKKNNDRIEILDNKRNAATISEYKIDNEEHKKTWIAKIGIDEFYHKYYRLYEIQKEKEVMAYAGN